MNKQEKLQITLKTIVHTRDLCKEFEEGKWSEKDFAYMLATYANQLNEELKYDKTTQREEMIEEIEKEKEKWEGIYLRVGSKEVAEALQDLISKLKT